MDFYTTDYGLLVGKEVVLITRKGQVDFICEGPVVY